MRSNQTVLSTRPDAQLIEYDFFWIVSDTQPNDKCKSRVCQIKCVPRIGPTQSTTLEARPGITALRQLNTPTNPVGKIRWRLCHDTPSDQGSARTRQTRRQPTKPQHARAQLGRSSSTVPFDIAGSTRITVPVRKRTLSVCAALSLDHSLLTAKFGKYQKSSDLAELRM